MKDAALRDLGHLRALAGHVFILGFTALPSIPPSSPKVLGSIIFNVHVTSSVGSAFLLKNIYQIILILKNVFFSLLVWFI